MQPHSKLQAVYGYPMGLMEEDIATGCCPERALREAYSPHIEMEVYVQGKVCVIVT